VRSVGVSLEVLQNYLSKSDGFVSGERGKRYLEREERGT
jgi:hypothetical protein